MIVYSSTKDQFNSDVHTSQIERVIQQHYFGIFRRNVSQSELRSWRNSLEQMSLLLSGNPAIPGNCGIAIEFTLPPTSKRIDFLISGLNSAQQPAVCIIELKQWEACEVTELDGVVKTYLGGSFRETVHPSYQAWSYQSTLMNFNESVYNGGVSLTSCAFLHNMESDRAILDSRYTYYTQKSPVFIRTKKLELTAFITKSIAEGDEGAALRTIENGRIRPSKKLSAEIVNILKQKSEFTLLDDQKLVFEKCFQMVKDAKEDEKRVVIVRGGPGTGKSVVALNLLVHLISERQNAAYVSKNAAPRTVYKERLFGAMTKAKFDSLFLGSGKFIEASKDSYDGLVIDEAHRLNEKSGLYGNLGENQVKEIIQSAKASVFFLDENQKVSLSDIGNEEMINYWANYFDAQVEVMELTSQFRCAGSDIYLAWLDHTLGIRETAHSTLKGTDYQFQVMDSPNELFDKLYELNKEKNSARVVAGYCYPWRSKKDSEAMDIIFEDFGFQKQWNLASDGSTWIERPDSIEQIGCIHTCQGLEVEHIGVIIGKDLYFQDGEVRSNYTKRDRHDNTMKGIKKRIKEFGEIAEKEADLIIRNTYRTLMTRGMKSCSIWCEDPALNKYIKSVLEG